MDTPLKPSARPWFFCGIGGSGMLPLAQIVQGLGGTVAGSDRSRDQGRTPDKFAWLADHGFTLFPQDGSGVTSPDQVVVASAAVEDTVPEIVRARALGCDRMTRAELNSALFNAAPASVAIAGTSGKSTVTAMLGWILHSAGRAPTIMNGAVMKNFASAENSFASAHVGGSELYVSEVDESDGSIALYRPAVGVLLNVSLDHKSMDELRLLFADFLRASATCAVNLDDPEVKALAQGLDAITFSVSDPSARISVEPGSADYGMSGLSAVVTDGSDGSAHRLSLAMPGRHNLANALAAIAGAAAAGVAPSEAVAALTSFRGLARRFDVIGTSPGGITVIDDFGHNPEKCAATLRTLKQHSGRVIAFFQPHGYGPLRQMGLELADTFARELGPNDVTIICDPVYFGGTVDRSGGSQDLVAAISAAGRSAEYIAERAAVADRIAAIARDGDRIAIMGARDDTLTEFARDLLARLR
ncbi:Mur ligase family protein [Altererythrobacter sp. TH136]|uniref:glutamate ligase domain-containing protein n=1 Tax=Altererythrobacter sp. TH136 TaxID=2067415 RepID=UPI0011632DCB|nr:Mur ligase family protein [Altererythrobacter sp. TH136]QDM39786.1 UDP-N-acetylmuramate--alanine ligase [Altererythrobacter sp. TH136]